MNLEKVSFHKHNSDNQFSNNDYNYKGMKYIKKKKKFIVFDGFIKILINPNALSCNVCKRTCCKHINFVLHKHYNIPNNLLPMLRIKSFTFNFNTFQEDIKNHYNEYECCICLRSNEAQQHYWICQFCSQMIHFKCVHEWVDIKKNNNCPLCKHIILKL